MLNALDSDLLYQRFLEADEAGVKLELVEGVPTWEFHPSPSHQILLRNILRSITIGEANTGSCGCYEITDVYIRFPDGSLKRPDISVFCEMPAATSEALRTIPEAVVEIVSPGSEKKDLETGPSFYLRHGVLDVVVVNPATQEVLHHRKNGLVVRRSPVTIKLECGCSVTC